MSLTQDDVKRILELVEKSAFEELHLEIGDFRLAVSKHGQLTTAPATAAANPGTALAVAPMLAAAAAPAPAVTTPTVLAAPVAQEAGLIEIKAPIVGIFYTAPEPGAASFVEPGVQIDENSTVGLVEVMKVFNTIKSGVRGTVVKRLVENNDFVEFGQPLFLVRPAEG